MKHSDYLTTLVLIKRDLRELYTSQVTDDVIRGQKAIVALSNHTVSRDVLLRIWRSRTETVMFARAVSAAITYTLANELKKGVSR